MKLNLTKLNNFSSKTCWPNHNNNCKCKLHIEIIIIALLIVPSPIINPYRQTWISSWTPHNCWTSMNKDQENCTDHPIIYHMLQNSSSVLNYRWNTCEQQHEEKTFICGCNVYYWKTYLLPPTLRMPSAGRRMQTQYACTDTIICTPYFLPFSIETMCVHIASHQNNACKETTTKGALC